MHLVFLGMGLASGKKVKGLSTRITRGSQSWGNPIRVISGAVVAKFFEPLFRLFISICFASDFFLTTVQRPQMLMPHKSCVLHERDSYLIRSFMSESSDSARLTPPGSSPNRLCNVLENRGSSLFQSQRFTRLSRCAMRAQEDRLASRARSSRIRDWHRLIVRLNPSFVSHRCSQGAPGALRIW